jgi:two-component system sensor histidine kinase CiaH
MFHSAALRLTVWYLGIIMAISLLFSLALYRVSSNQLAENAEHQIGYFNNILGPGEFNNYSHLRERQLNEDRDHLKGSLLFFNLMVLAAGGAASYLLARRTLQPIEEALNSQSQFAADASHELRTPLAAIQAENEVALRSASLTKAQAVELLKSNLEEVAKLKALSDGLLRLTGGQDKVEFEKVSIKDIIPLAIERLSKTAAQKKIKLIDNSKSLTVKGDLASLTELVSIFIDNAIKYSPAGSKINLNSHRDHRNIVISVKDAGQGIDSHALPHIFDRFYRAEDSRSKQTGGYGLGLAIARKIAEAHDGYIEVKSQPGVGSTFSLHLPSA